MISLYKPVHYAPHPCKKNINLSTDGKDLDGCLRPWVEQTKEPLVGKKSWTWFPYRVPDWDRAMNAWLVPRVERLDWSISNFDGG